jgi:hypothetical protein
MSAWIVSRAHIDALVLAGVQWGTIADPTPEKLTELGRMLWAENLTSVAYRYPNDTGNGDRPGPINFRDNDVKTYTAPTAELLLLSAAGIVNAIDCYDYQSCEHPQWRDPDNPAASYTRTLRKTVLATFPPNSLQTGYDGIKLYPPGYDAAPWGVDDLAEITARTARSER